MTIGKKNVSGTRPLILRLRDRAFHSFRVSNSVYGRFWKPYDTSKNGFWGYGAVKMFGPVYILAAPGCFAAAVNVVIFRRQHLVPGWKLIGLRSWKDLLVRGIIWLLAWDRIKIISLKYALTSRLHWCSMKLCTTIYILTASLNFVGIFIRTVC